MSYPLKLRKLSQVTRHNIFVFDKSDKTQHIL